MPGNSVLVFCFADMLFNHCKVYYHISYSVHSNFVLSFDRQRFGNLFVILLHRRDGCRLLNLRPRLADFRQYANAFNMIRLHTQSKHRLDAKRDEYIPEGTSQPAAGFQS